MGKNKNWTRRKDRETGNMYRSSAYYWINDKTGKIVEVRRIFINKDASRSDYPRLDGSSYIYDISGPTGRIGREYYENKEEARKVAVAWMRNHPRG